MHEGGTTRFDLSNIQAKLDSDRLVGMAVGEEPNKFEFVRA